MKFEPHYEFFSKDVKSHAVVQDAMPSETHLKEHSHKKDYWYSELRSLGIEPKRLTELNDNDELGKLADNLKQTMFQDYKTAYNHTAVKKSHLDYVESNFDYII